MKNFLTIKKFLAVVSVGIILMSGTYLFKTFFNQSYQELVTSSGLEAVFFKDADLPYLNLSLWFFDVGSDYEMTHKSGLNFITAHLLEQGAGGLSSETIQDQIDHLGASFEVHTGRQYSVISINGLSWQAKELWDIFLKIATEAHLEEKEFEIFKQRLLESRYSDLDSPQTMAHEIWRQLLFPVHHPMGQPEEGTLTSLKQISLEDVKSFFKNHYLNPDLLTVVGHFNSQTQKDILTSFDQAFSKKQNRSVVSGAAKKPNFFKLLKKKNELQSQIHMGFQTLAFPTNQDRLVIALRLANQILGGREFSTNRLMFKLREEMGLTYGVGSTLSLGRAYGLFQVVAQTKTENTGLFLKESLNILKHFQDKGITKDELQLAKMVLKSYFFQQIETPEQFLFKQVYYSYYLQTSSDFMKNYISIIDDISVQEVNQAIKQYFIFKNLSVLVYGNPVVKNQLMAIEDLSPLEDISFEEYFASEIKNK